jgi:hypothetical protein
MIPAIFSAFIIFLYIVIFYIFGSKSAEMNKFSEWIWLRIWITGWWLLPALILILNLYNMIQFEHAVVIIIVFTVIYLSFAYTFFRRYFPKEKERKRNKAIKKWKK